MPTLKYTPHITKSADGYRWTLDVWTEPQVCRPLAESEAAHPTIVAVVGDLKAYYERAGIAYVGKLRTHGLGCVGCARTYSLLTSPPPLDFDRRTYLRAA